MRAARNILVQAVNGNPVSADEAWTLIHAWDAMVEAIEIQTAYQRGERDMGVALWEWPSVDARVGAK